MGEDDSSKKPQKRPFWSGRSGGSSKGDVSGKVSPHNGSQDQARSNIFSKTMDRFRRSPGGAPSSKPSEDKTTSVSSIKGSGASVEVKAIEPSSRPPIDPPATIELVGQNQSEQAFQNFVKNPMSTTADTTTSFGQSNALKEGFQEAKDAVSSMRSPSGAVKTMTATVTSAVAADNNMTDAANTFGLLLRRIEIFQTVINAISEVHPYVQMALTVFSAVSSVIIGQMKLDQNIVRLLDIINRVYNFVEDSKALREIQSHTRVLSGLARQTLECSYFIRDYSKVESFWRRVKENFLSDVDATIKAYESSFADLMSEFRDRAALNTEVLVRQTDITVVRILDDVQKIGKYLRTMLDLNSLSYAAGASYNTDKQCLAGTRVGILEEISEWINNEDAHASRVLWLCGPAGTGKSAIAHTIARQFDDIRRLGSCFCFDNSIPAERRHEKVFITIARDIADRDARMKQALAAAVHDRNHLKSTPDIRQQWENLFLQPVTQLSSAIVGPIVIIIEGLDESGNADSRRVLLSILAEGVSDLPANFRIIVTSRPLADIYQTLHGKPHVHIKQMDMIPTSSTKDDISIYVGSRLAGVDDSFFVPQNLRFLVDKAEGLFQWAYLACEYVRSDDMGGLTVEERFDDILSLDTSSDSTAVEPLDGMYSKILSTIFDTKNKRIMARFTSVMGQVLAALEPLSTESLNAMRALQNSGGSRNEDVGLIVRYMGSVLSGATESSTPIRPLHSSFREFLTEHERSGGFFVDISDHQQSLSKTCLQVMEAGLRFNICNLESSYVRNTDVVNLEELIQQNIPPHLSYSCRFWASHIHSTLFNSSLVPEIRKFYNQHFLFWLEVLSLTKSVNTATALLSYVLEWITDDDDFRDVLAFTADAQRFIRLFGGIISQSVPHIYLSALPFCPENSVISAKLSPRFPQTLRIFSGQANDWQSTQSVLEDKHSASILSVAFSPDGKIIISGAEDMKIGIWDAETGEALHAPFKAHTAAVKSVAFSPDGKTIVSGSSDRTIRFWNIELGKEIGAPLEIHTDQVLSVSFSPDGNYIASGSADSKICITDTRTREIICPPLQEHTESVNCVAFSPDGRTIASASHDMNIGIWDSGTGKVLFILLKAHTAPIRSVTFSPNGRSIVSGSQDCTVCIWDVETRKKACVPLRGHVAEICSVICSPDGSLIVSGSDDNTICVWNATTYQSMGIFEGHTGPANSIAFSPEGKRIVSGSYDQTIRIWDTKMAKIADNHFEGHNNWIRSAMFSPDGNLIASGSDDWSVRIWDAHTGEPKGYSLKGHTDYVRSIAFSPGGECVASGSDDNQLRMWYTETGLEMRPPLQGHTSHVFSVSFSPDGKYIASGSADCTIRLWSAQSGEAIGVFTDEHSDWVRSVAFSPDSKNIASGSDDMTVRIREVETKNTIIVARLQGHENFVRCVAFSPDGGKIVSGSDDKKVRIWDARTGDAVVPPLEGHLEIVYSVAYSPDGRWIVSGSGDSMIRVWDTRTHTTRAFFYGHVKSVYSVSFSANSKKIISGAADMTIRIWDAEGLESVDNTLTPVPIVFSSSQQHKLLDADALLKDIPPMKDEWRGSVKLGVDGWVVGRKGQLLFWVPPMHRSGLLWPRNERLIGSKAAIELDFSYFKHGKSWILCSSAM